MTSIHTENILAMNDAEAEEKALAPKVPDWKKESDAIKRKLKRLMEKHGVTIEAKRIDKRTRSFDSEWDKSAMHSSFVILKNGVHIYSGEYSAGEAHAWPDSVAKWIEQVNKGRAKLRVGFFHGGTETGRVFREGPHARRTINRDEVVQCAKAGWMPDAFNIMQSVLTDCTSDSFESWASDMGMDTDSRKAEKAWNECRESDRVCRQIFGRDFETACDLAQQF